MGVTRFTASGSNRVKWTTLTAALRDVSDGAHTLIMGAKRATDDGNFHGLSYLLSSTGDGVVENGLSLNSSDALVVDADGFAASTITITGTTETYVIACRKAAGNAALTYSRYVKSTTTWTHHSPGNRPDQTDATMLEVGAWQNGDFFDGWIPFVAWYEGVMSQADLEATVTNWQTSDLWNSAHGTPAFLVEGNVAGASWTDLASNASSITVTGTSLDAGETFASWNFNGTGAAAAKSLIVQPYRQTASIYSR